MQSSAIDNQFPPFPKEIVRGLAREFVEIYEPIRETSPQALWLSFMCNLGCMVSPYVRLNANSSEPRIYGVILGRSARTRKSTALNAAADVFKSKEFSQYVRTIRGFGSSEGLMCTLGVSKEPAPVIVHFDEINVLARKTSQDGSAGISAFNTLYEDHDYDHPLARDAGYTVRNAYVSLIGASTVDDFVKTWKGQHQDAGFLNRLLIVGVDRPEKDIAFPVDPEADRLEVIRRSISELYQDVQQRPRKYRLSKEAERLWSEFYAQRGDSPEWDRIDTYGLRLMALQTLLERDEAVTAETVERVISFLSYEVVVRQAATPIVAENQTAELEQQIQSKLANVSEMTKRTLYRATNANRKGIQIFNRALDNLAKEGVIVYWGKGRSVLYRLAIPEDASDGIASVIRDSDDNQGQAKCRYIQ